MFFGHTCLYRKINEYKYKTIPSPNKAGYDMHMETWEWERCSFCNVGVGKLKSTEIAEYVSYKDIENPSLWDGIKSIFNWVGKA